MIDPVQVLWSPAGATVPSLGDLALVDVHDGDTPSVRMSVRMLSIDTPEITAISAEGALNVDRKFADLAQWITDRKAPITAALAERVLPKLEKGGSTAVRAGHQGRGVRQAEHRGTARRGRTGASATCSCARPTPPSTPTTGCSPTSRRTTRRRSSRP